MPVSRLRDDPAYRAEVARIVAEAPPLSERQFDRLAVLLNPAPSPVADVIFWPNTERKAA